jgi:hypothetical protein
MPLPCRRLSLTASRQAHICRSCRLTRFTNHQTPEPVVGDDVSVRHISRMPKWASQKMGILIAGIKDRIELQRNINCCKAPY